jgi:hypothetical protein
VICSELRRWYLPFPRLATRAAGIWRLADGKATERWTYAEDQAVFDKFFG